MDELEHANQFQFHACTKRLSRMQGQVLNQTSAWWMHSTQHIAPNALLAVPDPNVSIMRRCRVFPVEFVVRGYLTGNASQVGWV